MKLRQLEMELQRCRGFEKPRVSMEQYQTPAPLAARLLYDAFLKGDIEGKSIVDLGCGTGILSIGAALLGARTVTAIDADNDAIRIARKNAELFGVDITFVIVDLKNTPSINSLKTDIGPCDTVIMNPPFGAQKQNVHADRAFIDHALELAPITYGIFNLGSTEFISKYIEKRGTITDRISGVISLKHSFAHHTREVQDISVEILRLERKQ